MTMATILVCIDPQVPGRTHGELITLAHTLGTAVAVSWAPSVGRSAAMSFGATALYLADRDCVAVQDAAGVVLAAAAAVEPAAVLFPTTIDSTEIAAIVALGLGAGLISNVTTLDVDLTCHTSIFGGSTTISSRSKGVLVATIRPSAIEPVEASRAMPGACD